MSEENSRFLKALHVNKLEAGDFRHGPVVVTMQEGSFFCWYDAFLHAHEGYLYVYTEHYGYHRFELEMVTQYSGPEGPKKRKRP